MNNLKRFLPYFNYLKPIWGKFVLGVFFGITYSVFSGFGLPFMVETAFPILFDSQDNAPKWIQYIVVNYFNFFDNGFLVFCCLSIPFIMFIRAFSAWGNGFYINYVGIHVVQSIQKNVFNKIQILPFSFYKSNKTGEIISSIIDYPEQIKRVVVDTSNDIIKQPLTLVSAIIFLIYKSYQSDSFFIVIIGLISVPMLVLPIKMIGDYLRKKAKEIVTYKEKLNSWAIETIQSPTEIKSYNLEERQKKIFSRILDNIFKFLSKTFRTMYLISPSIEFISSLGFALALYLGVRNGLSEGDFVSLFVALYMCYDPLKKIGLIHGLIKQVIPPLERVNRILDLEISNISSPNAIKISNNLKGNIEFNNVSFYYEKSSPVLENLNVKINSGDTLAVTGKSGSGKSTFLSLILRLFDTSNGNITIDGINIKRYDIKQLRDNISFIPQLPLLFNSSIKDNIKVGNLLATDDEVFKAAKKANVMEFVENMPNGLDTILGEKGSSISGGQRQRIAIARAYLKDAPIMLLDEPTSSLDEDSAIKLYNELINSNRDKTIIFVTHDSDMLNSVDKKIKI